MHWKVEPDCVLQHLHTACCSIVAGGSFFPHRPWHISASWHAIADNIIIGLGDFISSASTDCRSTHAAELCGDLVALQSIDYYLSQSKEDAKIDMSVATDCVGVITRLRTLALIVTMSTKLHAIVREFLHLASKRLKSLEFIKVAAHQDDLKSFNQLSFLEQLNVKCNARAKALILAVSEDAIIPLPLTLSSLHM